MTVEIALAICVGAAFCCYLVWKWQEAAVDMAVPPYQEPVKQEVVEPEPETKPLNPQAAWPFPTNTKP